MKHFSTMLLASAAMATSKQTENLHNLFNFEEMSSGCSQCHDAMTVVNSSLDSDGAK